uniref:Uncharacterized protein n=1 Tax=Rhizophora mucronata TaxID=61149 RepID=A0A2P2ML62_RHIMU
MHKALSLLGKISSVLTN